MRSIKRSRAAARLLPVALALLFGRPVPASGQAPDERWRTMETEHFRVTYPEGLEELAGRAALRAEESWARLEGHFVEPPPGTIDLLLTDHTDQPNGFAQVTPSNRITIFARPPVDFLTIGHHDEWLELVILHELAHILHLDHVDNPVGGVARAVFGRGQYDFPFFPERATPLWLIEGIATWYESRFTGAGRVRGTILEAQVRTAVLEGRFESVDQASGDSPLWPGSNRSYAYGAMFFDFLLDRHGEEKLAAFVEAIGDQWIPYRIDSAARDAFGVSVSEEWEAWGDSLRVGLADFERELARHGPVTEAERLTTEARWGLHPTPSPDGRRLAYTRADGRSDSQILVRDLEGEEIRSLGRTNGIATFGWIDDEHLLVSQLELSGPYRTYGDLYVFDLEGRQRRLTRGARLGQPHVDAEGVRAVAVQQGEGTNGLVVVDVSSGEVRTLVAPRPDVHWAFPRWSPDRRWIAATRWTPGAWHDLVVLDGETGAVVHRVTEDRALDLGAAWSADGRWLVWASDRSGVANVLGAAVDGSTGRTSEPRMLTNVRTAAAHPSVAPDGRTLYFSGHHVDGWEVERVPFAPESSAPAPTVDARFEAVGSAPQPGSAGGAPRPYSPFPTLRPTYWEVEYGDPVVAPQVRVGGDLLPRRELLGFSLGARTGGVDLVGRHAWGMVGRLSTSGSRFSGAASYSYRGLGNPVLRLAASQGYRDGGQFLVGSDPDTLLVLERTRSVEAAATLLRPSWRTDVSLTLGAGLSWERRELLDPRLAPSTDFALDRETVRFATWRASLSVNSSRSHAFQMGTTRGAALFLSGLLRQELALPDSIAGAEGLDRSVGELVAQFRGALPLWELGFARHVLALRGTAGAAAGPGAGPFTFRIGGASGQREALTGQELFGGDFILFPLRAYPLSSRVGRYAWSATAEYRFPLLLVNRGVGAWPVHLDRILGSVFVDAGNAWGPDLSPSGVENPLRSTLVSVGAEVTAEILGLYDVVLRMRGGVGVPLVAAEGVGAWIRVGLPF